MCWPDLWDYLDDIGPTLGLIGALTAYVSVIALLLWAPKLRKRSFQITSRLVGVLLIIPLAFALPPLALGTMFRLGNPPAQVYTVTSPGGQSAELRYSGGFLGRDYTEVKLKTTGCCAHTRVFWHAGPSYMGDPRLTWLNSHSLQIVFHTRPDDPAGCEHTVRGVAVTCVPIAWPDQVAPPTQSQEPE